MPKIFVFHLIALIATIISSGFSSTNSGLVLFIFALFCSHLSWTRVYKYQNTTLNMGQVSSLIIIVILFIFFTQPVWENDFYRYMLDGLHLLSGIEPYFPSPIESPLKENYPSLIDKVGFPEVPTIYPPLAISIFSFLVRFSGENATVFLLLSRISYYIIFYFLMFFLTSKRKLEFRKLILITTHPLILVEGITNAHFDLILAGISALMLVSPQFMILFFPLAVSIKYTFITIFPIFLHLKDILIKIKSKIFYFKIGIIISLLPLFFGDFNLTVMLKNLSFFAAEWEMNSGIFRFFRWVGSFYSNHESFTVKFATLISGISYLLILFLIHSKREQFSIEKKLFLALSSLILLAPVCNPWYFLWMLPSAVLLEGKSGEWSRYFFLFAPLYYCNFLTDGLHEKFFISTLNLQHIWYILCFFKVYRSS